MPGATAASRAGADFRPEIEGLRAVASFLVAAFHIWVKHPSGGVDVFFVVSGFLITLGLLKQIERTGSVQFARFWAGLIKRLWPPALLVLSGVIVASFLLLPQSRWKETIVDVAAAAAYVENWQQIRHVSYTPVLHYWALSVQGQFYLFWPLLLAFTLLAAKRLQLGFRGLLTAVFGVVFALSLAFSIVMTARDQLFAYNNTFARVWEFSVGGLLALLLPQLQASLSRPVRAAAGWIGFIAIVSCGFVLPVQDIFPGYAALWPVLGGALVLIAGTSGSRFGADRILGSRLLVRLGGISYGLYLWHYPILMFWVRLSAPRAISAWEGAAIFAASIVAAYLSTRLLEAPIRNSAIGKQRPAGAFALGAVAMAPVVLGLALWLHAYKDAKDRERIAQAPTPLTHPGALVLERGFEVQPAAIEAPVLPGPLSVQEDREYLLHENCGRADDPTQPEMCMIGVPNPKRTLVVVGDSHSSQWLPALQTIAVQSDWKLVVFTRSDCPFDRALYLIEDDLGDTSNTSLQTCVKWNENVVKNVRELQPDAVFTTATFFTSQGEEILPPGRLQAWEELAASGIRVIALRDNPSFGFDVSACVELHGPSAPECSVPREAVLDEPSPVESLPHQPRNVQFMDLSDYFCEPETCRPVIGNVLVYRKLDHLTATYVRTLTPMLRRELLRALEPGNMEAGRGVQPETHRLSHRRIT